MSHASARPLRLENRHTGEVLELRRMTRNGERYLFVGRVVPIVDLDRYLPAMFEGSLVPLAVSVIPFGDGASSPGVQIGRRCLFLLVSCLPGVCHLLYCLRLPHLRSGADCP